MSNQLESLSRSVRNHLHFIIIVPLIIIVMTWPTFLHVFEADSFWLAGHDIDANMLFWDTWYFKLLINGQADFYFTDLLFYPHGVSLAFHNFSLPHMVLFAGFQTILPGPNAYNLTYLLLVFATALSGYIYLNYLFRDKWISLFGAVVFGTSGFVLAQPSHPNISFIATLPLSLYFFHRGVVESRRKFVLVAGGLIGVTAFIGMYTLVCLLLTLALFILYFATSRWKQPMFWLNLCLLSFVILGVLILRFYPMILDQKGLAGALSKYEDKEAFKELLGNFVNYYHPITRPVMENLFPIRTDIIGFPKTVFLGFVPVLLIAAALARKTRRREALAWFTLALAFLVLRLGSNLQINGVQYENILLPKYYLVELIPHIFKPFWSNDNFHAGALLPIAVLCCFGIMALTRSLSPFRSVGVILVLTALVAFEYYQAPNPIELLEGHSSFIDWLRQDDDQDSIHLINLPLGGQLSKYYGYYQSMSGYPHVEGRPTRTPPAAFRYIESNSLLRTWQAGRSVRCFPFNVADYRLALNQLEADGFSHVILHRWLRGDQHLAYSFAAVQPAYEDDFVTIYRVVDLHRSCDSAAYISPDALSHISTLSNSRAIFPNPGSSILGIRPYEPVASDQETSYSSFLYDARSFLPLNADELIDTTTQDNMQLGSDINTVLASNNIVLLVYDSGQTDPGLLDTYRSWVSGLFNSCGRLTETDDIIIEHYFLFDFPCELAIDEDPMAVNYDSGIQLGNLLVVQDGRSLDLYLMWKTLPSESHSFSVQLFDGEGNKALGQDFTFRHDPLMHKRIDLSSLPLGYYLVKFIVYNYHTGISVSGTQLDNDTRFDRELEIALISVD